MSDKKSKKRTREEDDVKNGKSEYKSSKVKKVNETSNGNNTHHVIANIDDEENKPLTDFRISKTSIEALNSQGITSLFPIQWRLYDSVIEGYDVIGRARTGSGKTISYVLPIIERLIRRFKKPKSSKKSKDDDEDDEKKYKKDPCTPNNPFVLILAPTRELVRQVDDVIKMIGKPHGITSTVIYGGASYEIQESMLKRGVDIIVATPGRLIDHLERGNLKFDLLRCLVLDEADEMLNIGFKESIEKILEFIPKDKKKKHQTLLYSATIPDWVNKITKKYLQSDYKRVDLIGNQKNKTSETVRHLAIKVPAFSKAAVISDILKVYGKGGNAIIFCDTKNEANELGVSSSQLQDCQVIHGDIVQSQRELTMDAFRNNKFRVLVATDVAARGLDIDNVDLVIQVNPPGDVENFIHRSGRTGRAGKHGINCVLYTQRFLYRLKILEREAGIKFERIGAPQPKDIYKAASLEFIDRALDVKENHEELLNSFMDVAQQMINDFGDPIVALAASIAVGCGYEEPIKKRSLLTGTEGKVTLKLTLNDAIRSRSFVIRVILKALNHDENDFKSLGVGEIRLAKDGGAVVEVPENLVDRLIGLNNKWRTFERVNELPELEEEVESFSNNGRDSFRGGRGGGFGGSPSSRGGRGGGYSSGRGGGYSSGRGGRGGGFSSGRGGGYTNRYG